MACVAPGGEPPADAPDMCIVRRWVEGWSDDEFGVGWEQDGRLQGAVWARRVAPTLVREPMSGEPLPEVIISVVEALRGQGIGTRLVGRLLELADQVGAPGLSLTVSERNTAALRLYEHAGFVRHSERRDGLLVIVWRPVIDPNG